jgi:phosphoribosylformylglycinamidine synthase
VDVDPKTVAKQSPVYDRPYARPNWQDALQNDLPNNLARPSTPEQIRQTWLTLLASPNLCSRHWITDQYDRFVGGNTAMAMPSDAGVLRVDETTGLGVAIATDGSGRYSLLDPYAGGQLALAEAYRNVVCTGARPLAVTDCLNCGSPESPSSMWQLVEVMRGLADACQTLGIPVTGGNVSLYNETGEMGRPDSAIQPTPVVGVLGVLDDVSKAVHSYWSQPGLSLWLVGQTGSELAGSAWADVMYQHLGGKPPQVRLEAEQALAVFLQNAAQQGLLSSAHDLSEGGLAQALAESVLMHRIGAHVDLREVCNRDQLSIFEMLFSETTARVIITCLPDHDSQLQALAGDLPLIKLGVTGPADDLVLEGQFSLAYSDMQQAFDGTLAKHFG